MVLTETIEGVRPEIGMNDVDPLEHGHHTERVYHVGGEGGIQVDHKEGGLEVNNEHEGMEVTRLSEHRQRPSIPVSALTELATTPVSDGGEEASDPIPRICGMKRNWFWMLGALTILTTGGLIGGLVGGLATRDRHPATRTTLPFSNIAAVNWTTTAGNETSYAIFTQDLDQSLIVYTGNTNAWKKINISEVFNDSGALNVRAGTPLAAVAVSDLENVGNLESNQLNLFFLTPENMITQIVTYDATMQDWRWGDVGPHSDVNIKTAAGSQLAATWERCNNFTHCGWGCLSITIEDTQQNYVVANSTYNWTPAIAVHRLAMNSSISLISMNYGGDSDYAWGFFDTNGILGSSWQDYQNGNWWWTDQGRNILSDIQPSSLQQFAAASFENRTNAFITVVFPDGSVIGKHWDPVIFDWHEQAQVKLVNSPPVKFATIALTADTRFYGITNGSIQEYQMDGKDPYTFHWLGEVV